VSLRDKISDAIFEPSKEKPKAAPAVVPAQPVQEAHGQQYVSTEPLSALLGGSQPAGNAAYSKLLAKTNFDATEAGKVLKKYLDPLTTVLTDERLRAKTAAAEAQQHDGLTVQQILSTFDSLKEVIGQEKDKFNGFIANAKSGEIDKRKAQIDANQKQIDSLNADILRLSTDLANAQAKIDHATTEFQSAVATRTAELEQLKAHYASLLQ